MSPIIEPETLIVSGIPKRKLVRWMLFLLGPARETLEELAMEEPAIKKALTTLEFLSQDREARELYEARQKAMNDWISNIEGAREEGREEGKIQGAQNKAYEVARRMLEKGMPAEEVAELTELSVSEIKQIMRGYAH